MVPSREHPHKLFVGRSSLLCGPSPCARCTGRWSRRSPGRGRSPPSGPRTGSEDSRARHTPGTQTSSITELRLETNQTSSITELRLETNQTASMRELRLETNQTSSIRDLRLETNQTASITDLRLETNHSSIIELRL